MHTAPEITDAHELAPRLNGSLQSRIEDIDNRFANHPPRSEVQYRVHDRIRGDIGDVARDLLVLCPPCRELDLAVTKLEEAMFWANAAVARCPQM